MDLGGVWRGRRKREGSSRGGEEGSEGGAQWGVWQTSISGWTIENFRVQNKGSWRRRDAGGGSI